MIGKLIEIILLFVISILMIPALPFIYILSKVYEYNHKDDPPNY
jgi:hypothetical protein